MKKIFAVLLVFTLMLSLMPTVFAATPADFGWESDSGDYSGWVVTDSNNFTINSNGTNNKRCWKSVIDDNQELSVSATVQIAGTGNAYIKVLGTSIELNCEGSEGDQIYCRDLNLWFDAAGQLCDVSIVRHAGAKLHVTLTGKSNATPVTFDIAPAEETREQLEVGMNGSGSATFSALSVLCGSASVFVNAGSPKSFGWFTDAAEGEAMDFTGWKAVDAANIRGVLDDALNDRMMKRVFYAETDFTVSLVLDLDESSSAYVKVLGQSLELDARHGSGDQAYLKLNGVNKDWISAAGAVFTISISRTGGGDLNVTITGKDNSTPVTAAMTPNESSTNLELGLYAGSASFMKVAVTNPTMPVFTDVPANSWYRDSVYEAVLCHLFSGISNTLFSPLTNTSRAMLVSVLYRLDGNPSVEGLENPFTDVPDGKWYTNAILWAAKNNIVAGTGAGKYDPDGNVNREQTAAVLFRYANYKGCDTSARADLSVFPDAGSVSSWAKEALSWANSVNLITGTKQGNVTSLSPKGSAVRAQVASLLVRFDKYLAD